MEKSCLTCKHGKLKPSWGLDEVYCYSPKLHLNNKDADGNPCDFTHLTKSCNCHEPRKEKEKKMTKEEAIINHRHMWSWLGENPMSDKSDYMIMHNVNPDLYQECFLCEYHNTHRPNCGESCILKWPGDNCMVGLFGKWKLSSSFNHRSELARQIRDLPERGEPWPVTAMLGASTGRITSRDAFIRIDPGKLIKVKTPPPKLTRSEAISKTREQWKWYARNPSKDKEAYFETMPEELRPLALCYLCEYTRKHNTISIGPDNCGERCPLKWPGGCCELEPHDGLFSTWQYNENDLVLRSAIATVISLLPEKEE